MRISPATSVALRANIDKAGLTIAGKSRALAAADRLLGGLLGIPAAYFEGVRSRVEAKNTIRLEQIRPQKGEVIDALEVLGEHGQMAMRRLVAEELRKQSNREAVWVETEEAIRALPEPDVSAPTDESPKIDDDWINLFSDYAERASSDRLRQLWGQILAGEIRKPGSFAPSTLRIISEMDAEIAKAFQEVMETRICLSINSLSADVVLKPKSLEGDELVKWTFLEEVGLLQEVHGELGVNFTGDDEGRGYLFTKSFSLMLTIPKGRPKTNVPIVKITRSGQQISNILPWNEVQALRNVAALITDSKIGLDIGRIVRGGPNPLVMFFEHIRGDKPPSTS